MVAGIVPELPEQLNLLRVGLLNHQRNFWLGKMANNTNRTPKKIVFIPASSQNIHSPLLTLWF
jgi:hypothetical protein